MTESTPLAGAHRPPALGLFVAACCIAAAGCGASRPPERARSRTAASAATLHVDWPSAPTRTEEDYAELGHYTIDMADAGSVRFGMFRSGRQLSCVPVECLDMVRDALVMTDIRSSMTAGDERAVLGDAGGAPSRGFTLISPLGTILADAYVLDDAVVRLVVYLPAGTTSDPAADAFLRSARVR